MARRLHVFERYCESAWAALLGFFSRRDERPEPLRDPLDHLAELSGLLVGKSGRRLVEQDHARASDHRASDLHEPSLPRTELADLGLRRHVQADEVDRGQHIGSPGRAPGTRMLVDQRHVGEHRQLLDRHLRLEGAPEPPARPLVVGHPQEILAKAGDQIDPAAGLTNPLSTLKNVVLPAPFGPFLSDLFLTDRGSAGKHSRRSSAFSLR